MSTTYHLFKYIHALLTTNERQSDVRMGNAIATVTNLAGVHGPSVGIAIGVSLGVLLCLAVIFYYQTRQLKKKIRQLMLATPEAQLYKKPSGLNKLAYRNLAYINYPNAPNNNQGNRVVQGNPGGIPEE